jgi:molecular chaperone DnaK (HSP70)
LRTFLGIDFGTTQTSVARTTDGRKFEPEIIEIDGKKAIATALRVVPDGIVELFGDEALEKLDEAPQDTVYDFKPEIGRKNKADYMAGLFLETLREKIESGPYNGARLSDIHGLSCVIGCPAMWDGERRRVLSDIAAKAGFPNVSVCDEPLGVVHFHHFSGEMMFEKPQNVLVYDFGGGTTDVAIEHIETADGGEPQIGVLACKGLSAIGGRNFDNTLERFFEEQLSAQGVSVTGSDRSSLKQTAKKLKESLMNHYNDRDEAAQKGYVARVPYKLLLTKKNFDDWCASIIQRFREPIDAVLEEAELDRDDIAAVLLAGGSTRLYYVKDWIKASFPSLPQDKIIQSVNPVEVVAKGLALKARYDVCGVDVDARTATPEAAVKREDLSSDSDYQETEAFWARFSPLRVASDIADGLAAAAQVVGSGVAAAGDAIVSGIDKTANALKDVLPFGKNKSK